MNYSYKNVELPTNHGFNDEHLKFLKTLDEALENSKKGIRGDYDLLQKSINDLYVQISDTPAPRNEKFVNPKERELNKRWVKNFLQKKDTGSIEMELKSFDGYIDTSDGTTGGYIIPKLLMTEVMHYSDMAGVFKREARNLNFAGPGNSRKIPVENQGISVEWVDEGALKPVDKITFSQADQVLKKLAVIAVFTEEILEDEAIDLVSYVAKKTGEAIAAEEDTQYFAGVGSPWTGLINLPGIVPVSMDATETAADITADHLLSMVKEVPKGYRSGAKFYMHSDCFLSIMGQRVDLGSGNLGEYLVQQPATPGVANIWGYPIVLVDQLPSESDASTVSTPFMLFANLQKTAVYGQKNDVRVKILDQATITDAESNSINLAQTDMQAVRIFKRTGYVSTLPGGIAVLSTGPAT